MLGLKHCGGNQTFLCLVSDLTAAEPARNEDEWAESRNNQEPKRASLWLSLTAFDLDNSTCDLEDEPAPFIT
jgi:hypothetical protein